MVTKPALQGTPKGGLQTAGNDLQGRRIAARTTAIASGMHLLVDLACFYLLAGRFSAFVSDPSLIATGFLLYNALAFGLQLPIGEWTDRRRSVHSCRDGSRLAMTGMLLVAAGVLLPELHILLGGGIVPMPLASHIDFGAMIAIWGGLCVAAVGNACFHIGAGAGILRMSAGRRADSGVFIAGGALGVSLGTWMGRTGRWMPGMLLVAVGTVFALSYVAMRLQGRNRATPRMPAGTGDHVPVGGSVHNRMVVDSLAGRHAGEAPICRSAAAIVLLCLLAIMVRAYAGSAMPIVWKSRTDLGLFLLPSVCVFAGKFAGGFLADRFGARRTAVLSLLAALPLLFIWGGTVVPCAVGLFSVSITTSLTLVAIARVLPGHEGLAFGLTTLALLLGSTPTFLFRLPDPAGAWVLAGLTALAAGLLFLVLDNERAGRRTAWYDVGETDGSSPVSSPCNR